jgi:peptidoglycan/LPS O-acetylase OafA/YrhL
MKIDYRPEIDGLRALAVISVIVYHANINIQNTQFLNGGFFGVDIFFVISGYLISFLIFKELSEKKSFSFLNFYERRIRRIIPALFFVMICSIPIGWIILPPSSLISLSESIISSTGFVSNIYFHYSGIEYDAWEGLFVPLLHNWSLSVEEQFYIIFPFFIIIVFKYCKSYLPIFLIFFFGVSFFMHLMLNKNYPSTTFYFLHTRIWEFLAGSILAHIEIKNGERSKNIKFNTFFPIIGIFIILYFLNFFDKGVHNLSYSLLTVIIGTCLFIWFTNKNDIITRLFSIKIIVYIGLISYSLYLWHYPLFSFAKISGIVSGSLEKKIILAFILFVFSIVSYFIIERPFRNKNFIFKKIIFLLFIIGFILLSINLTIIKQKGFPQRFSNLKLINSNYEIDNFMLAENKISYETANKKLLFLKDKTNVLILGDSHGLDMLNIFTLNNKLFSSYDFALRPTHDIKNLADDNIFINSDVILLSYRWNKLSSLDFLNDLILFLKNNNKKIIITSNTNEYKIFSEMYTLIDEVVLFSKKSFDYFGFKKLYFNNRIVHTNSKINVFLKKFAKTNNASFLNKEDYMCDKIKKECDYLTPDGYKIFYDYGHYTNKGAIYFGKKIHALKLFNTSN